MEAYGEKLICGHSIDPKHDIEDVDELKLDEEILDCDSKTVRMEAKHSEGVIRPIKFGNGGKDEENLTEIISVTNVDPKSFIPTSLLNWANRTLAFYAAKMIRNRCENLKGTTHAERVRTKPIYRKWKRDMKEYIALAKQMEQSVSK